MAFLYFPCQTKPAQGALKKRFTHMLVCSHLQVGKSPQISLYQSLSDQVNKFRGGGGRGHAGL